MVMDPRVNAAIGFVPQGIGADLIATLEGWGRAEMDGFRAAFAPPRRRGACRRAVREVGWWPVADIAGLPLLGADETIRPDATIEALAKLEPSFAMMGQMGFDFAALRKYTTVERINHVHHAGNFVGHRSMARR